MLKGEVTIQLKDVNTGEVEEYKGHNTVTNAIDEFFSLYPLFCIPNNGISMNDAGIDKFFPIATKALGGLILFSESISNSATEICIPPDKKILAFAADDADNVSACRGTYNTLESGATQTGYRSVWDFSTSQANGTIVTVGRTHLATGKNMYSNNILGDSGGIFRRRILDSVQQPICYKDNYLYYLRGTSPTSKNIVLCRKYEPMILKVSDEAFGPGEEEIVSTFETSVNYAAPTYTCNGCNGYAYSTIERSTTTKYIKISLTDFTITEHSFTTPMNTGYYPVYSKGYAYHLSSDRSKVFIVDLSNDTYIEATLPSTPSSFTDGICQLSNGSIGINIPISSESSAPYAIIYSDGTVLHVQKAVPDIDSRRIILAGEYSEQDTLLYRTFDSNGNPQFAINLKYLGTVFTLPSPITKTANQVMKVIYTLTDATE